MVIRSSVSPGRPRLVQDPVYQAADQALAERGLELKDHVVLRENLASCLAQADSSDLSEVLGQQSRWSYKLHRDLDKPYTDQQVFERLQGLEQLCQQLAGNTFPVGQWYISGSLTKGRLGAHSDVDLTCDGGFRPGQMELLNDQGPWGAAAFREEFQSGDPQLLHGSVHHGEEVSAVLVTGPLLQRKLSEYDAVVPLEVQKVEHEHGFLADIYVRALERKGYQVERGWQGVTVVPPEFCPEHSPEKVWTRPGPTG